MPIESWLLKDQPVPFERCPHCGEPFIPFLRGQIQRRERSWFGLGPARAYCSLICWHCKEIVGYESPPDFGTTSQTP